jgi:hypothetical protein
MHEKKRAPDPKRVGSRTLARNSTTWIACANIHYGTGPYDYHAVILNHPNILKDEDLVFLLEDKCLFLELRRVRKANFLLSSVGKSWKRL